MMRLAVLLTLLVVPTVVFAEKARVFTKPDGSVIISRAMPGMDFTQAMQQTIATNPHLQGLPFEDVDETDIPTDRTKRHAWRLQSGKVKEDALVPDKPLGKEDARKATCAKVKTDLTAHPLLKELCDSF